MCILVMLCLLFIQRIDQLISEIDPDNTGIITFENFRRGIQTYLLGIMEAISYSGHFIH